MLDLLFFLIGATVTVSIGTGGGRDYSTLSAAISGLSSDTSSGDDVIFEVYADGVINDDPQFTSFPHSFNSFIVRPASGHEHNGIIGNGPIIQTSATTGFRVNNEDGVTIRGLEIRGIGTTNSNGATVRLDDCSDVIIDSCIVHDRQIQSQNYRTAYGIYVDLQAADSGVEITNNIVQNIRNLASTDGAGRASGIERAGASGAGCLIEHNSIYTTEAASGSNAPAIVSANTGDVVRNNLAFSPTSLVGSPGTEEYNGGSDSTFTGTGSLTSLVAGTEVPQTWRQFDWRLGPSATVKTAGTTGTGTYSGTDIAGETRSGSTPSMGAHEYVAGGTVAYDHVVDYTATTPPSNVYYRRMTGGSTLPSNTTDLPWNSGNSRYEYDTLCIVTQTVIHPSASWDVCLMWEAPSAVTNVKIWASAHTYTSGAGTNLSLYSAPSKTESSAGNVVSYGTVAADGGGDEEIAVVGAEIASMSANEVVYLVLDDDGSASNDSTYVDFFVEHDAVVSGTTVRRLVFGGLINAGLVNGGLVA